MAGRQETEQSFRPKDRSFPSGLLQNAWTMRGKARSCTGDYPSLPAPASPEDNSRKTNPRRWYQVGGEKGPTIKGSEFAEQVWPANAEEINPTLGQIFSIYLRRFFR